MSDPFTGPVKSVEDDSPRGRKEPRRNRWGQYLMPRFNGSFDPKTYGKEYGHQRVTTFAKMLADTYGLSQWKTRMALKGVSLRPDLYAQIAAANIEDSAKLNNLAEKAQEAAGSSKGAGLGTALHAFTERVDLGQTTPADVPAPWDRDVQAYVTVVEEYGFDFPVEFIEVVLVNETHELGGTADRIALLTKDIMVRFGDEVIILPAGTWVIVDVKTGRDLSYSMGDISIQLGEYATSDAAYDYDKEEFFPIPVMDKRVGFVIHVAAGSGKATVVPVDLRAGIEAATHAKFTREWRKRKNLAGKADVCFNSVEDIDENGQEFIPDGQAVGQLRLLVAIEKADSASALNELWRENKHVWDRELSSAAAARKEELRLIAEASEVSTPQLLNEFEAGHMDSPSWTDAVTEAVRARREVLLGTSPRPKCVDILRMIKDARSAEELTALWSRNKDKWNATLTRAAAERKYLLSAEATTKRAARVAVSAATRAEKYTDPEDKREARQTAVRAARVALSAASRASEMYEDSGMTRSEAHAFCHATDAPDDVMGSF